MPRPVRPWFRFYVEATHDMKLRQLTPTHRWLWVAVLSAARESPISGYLMASERLAISEPMLSDYAAVRLQDVKSGIISMESLGLIEWDSDLGAWGIPRWSDRQYESDDVTARTRKSRAKEQDRNVPRTFPGTPPETETETETEGGGKRAAKRAHRIPEDFAVSDAMRTWARDKPIRSDIDLETEKFVNYWLSNGAKKVAWTAAWRNWVIKADEYLRERTPDPSNVINMAGRLEVDYS